MLSPRYPHCSLCAKDLAALLASDVILAHWGFRQMPFLLFLVFFFKSFSKRKNKNMQSTFFCLPHTIFTSSLTVCPFLKRSFLGFISRPMSSGAFAVAAQTIKTKQNKKSLAYANAVLYGKTACENGWEEKGITYNIPSVEPKKNQTVFGSVCEPLTCARSSSMTDGLEEEPGLDCKLTSCSHFFVVVT